MRKSQISSVSPKKPVVGDLGNGFEPPVGDFTDVRVRHFTSVISVTHHFVDDHYVRAVACRRRESVAQSPENSTFDEEIQPFEYARHPAP